MRHDCQTVLASIQWIFFRPTLPAAAAAAAFDVRPTRWRAFLRRLTSSSAGSVACWSDGLMLMKGHKHPGVVCLGGDIKKSWGWNSSCCCCCFLFSLFHFVFLRVTTNLTTFSPDFVQITWFTCWKWWRSACAKVFSSRRAGSLAALVQADNSRLRASCDQSADFGHMPSLPDRAG